MPTYPSKGSGLYDDVIKYIDNTTLSTVLNWCCVSPDIIGVALWVALDVRGLGERRRIISGSSDILM